MGGELTDDVSMQADPRLMAELLSLIALMAATIEYGEIVQRRSRARAEATVRAESAQMGLLGLVRVFAVDEPTEEPTSPPPTGP